jgi:hypothetical protein
MRPGRAKVARENDFPVCGWQKPQPAADKSSAPQGRLEIGRDAILKNLQPSLRDLIMSHDVPRTSVLG